MKTANLISYVTGLAALTLGTVAACSSSASTTTGTETMTGTVTGAAAVTGNNGPTVPLTLRGPVATTSAFTPPGSGTHSVVTFRTPDGNLVVSADAPDANQNPVPNAATCLMKQTIHATYTVDGAKSTGKFAGATGSGKVVFYFSATAPKLAADGKCDTSENAQPLAKGAVVTFTASGPLTVKP